MKYLLDTNILRALTNGQATLMANLAKVPNHLIGIPLPVVLEQLRGRMDAVLKAEPENLLREQQRFVAAQSLLAGYQTVYLTDKAIAELVALRQRVKTHKRYADAVIAAIALAENCTVITRNAEDFKLYLPAARIENWIDQIY